MATSQSTYGANRKVHHLVGLLFMMFALSVIGAQDADAHASLLSTTPADGAQLESAPTEIVLEFSEPVGIVDGGTILHGSDTDPLALTPTTSGSSVIVTIDAPLDEGAYILQWRVISADSHPIAGTVSFTVGDADASTVTVETSDVPPWIEWARTFAVTVKYTGLLGAFGVLLVGSRLVPKDLSLTLKLASTFATIGIIGILVEIPFSAMVQRGEMLPIGVGLRDAIVGLDAGTKISAVIAIVLNAVLLLARRRLREWVIPTALTLGALLTLTGSGHTQSREPRWVMILSDAAHVFTAAIWLGGILLLTIGLLGRWQGEGFSTVESSFRAVSQFSQLAAITATIVIISGTAMAITILDSFDALINTDYGVTLLIKVGLVGVVLLIAAANRYWLIPQGTGESGTTIGWLRRLITIELVAMIAIVGITGSLVHRDPNVQAEQSSPATVLDDMVELDGNYSVTIQITRGSGGTIEITAQIIDADGEIVVPEDDLELGWYLPERDIGPISQSIEINTESNSYDGSISLPIAGEWQLEIRANIDRFTDSRATIDVPIPD